jgi:hypothetical protein
MTARHWRQCLIFWQTEQQPVYPIIIAWATVWRSAPVGGADEFDDFTGCVVYLQDLGCWGWCGYG